MNGHSARRVEAQDSRAACLGLTQLCHSEVVALNKLYHLSLHGFLVCKILLLLLLMMMMPLVPTHRAAARIRRVTVRRAHSRSTLLLLCLNMYYLERH